jgi:hypothetical protein
MEAERLKQLADREPFGLRLVSGVLQQGRAPEPIAPLR